MNPSTKGQDQNAADCINADPLVWDVLIVGAGLSGIGAARRLQSRCPNLRWAILESRQALGGTWDLFRYPGVRSDSDMFTLGFPFRPWTEKKSIADGPSILRYLNQVASETGVSGHIRYGQKVKAAQWDSQAALWRIEIEHLQDGSCTTVQTRFLWMCGGYYSYAQAHQPTWEGQDQFKGQWVHPQFWPQDLDYSGKRVVVIGSGATAVTLVPAMALPGHARQWGTLGASGAAVHVMLLQRSPTYMVAMPATDPWAKHLMGRLPAAWVARAIRYKNIAMGSMVYRWSRRQPESLKRWLLKGVQQQLGDAKAVADHFTPHYKPWDQRLCAVPGGDLFQAIRSGRASVVTDTIAHFVPDGMVLASGQHLSADIVVTATGLQLNALADIAFRVDGQAVDLSQTLAYKGMMLSGLPNFAMTFGYANASWTLKADLTANYVCRLLNHMRRNQYSTVVPHADARVQPMSMMPLSSGYVARSQSLLPKQGDRAPWQTASSYWADYLRVHWGRLSDGHLHYSNGGQVRS